jgi:hypothetical protein
MMFIHQKEFITSIWGKKKYIEKAISLSPKNGCTRFSTLNREASKMHAFASTVSSKNCCN